MFPRYVKRQATDPSGRLSPDWGKCLFEERSLPFMTCLNVLRLLMHVELSVYQSTTEEKRGSTFKLRELYMEQKSDSNL